jgi:hypothetical protein
MKHFLRVQESVGLGIMLLFDTITRIREAAGDRIEAPSAGWGAAKLVDEPLMRRSGVNSTGRQAA